MSLNLGDNFDYQGKKPNFVRDRFDTLEKMRTFPETSIDDGHISLCLEDGARYQYYSKNPLSPTTGKWVRIIDTTLNDSSENSVQNKVILAKFKEESLQTDGKILGVEEKIKSAVADLTKLIETNKTLTQAEINELSNTLSDSLTTISAALQDLKQSKLDSDVTINGKDLTSGNIDITKQDIGLGNVDNTSDLEKPLSRLATTALNGKVDKIIGSRLITEEEADKLADMVTTNVLDKKLTEKVSVERKVAGKTLNNDIILVSSDVGLGNVDNTKDIDKPVSTATLTALNEKVDKVPGSDLMTEEEKTKLASIPSNIGDHIKDIENPHNVTKAQVGLGNVDNTSDANKPLSTATQEALRGKVNSTTTVNGHALSNDVTITKGDIGLGNVENTSDLDKPISNLTLAELNKIKRVTAEGLMEIVDTIRGLSEIMSVVLNDMNSRIISLGKYK